MGGKCLRNRLPSARSNGNIPIVIWKQSTIVKKSNIPKFGQGGFSFVYDSATSKNKKLRALSEHSFFVGMENDESLCRIYDKIDNRVLIVQLSDLKQCG